MSESLKIGPSESVTVRRSSEEELEVEATYGPQGRPPPKHYHPAQDEHFEVLEGEVRTSVDGEERVLGPGESIEIPRRAVHQLWNSGDVPARVLWQTRPGGRTEQWFRAIDALHSEGRVGKNGMPGPLAFAVLLTAYRDAFRLDAKPEPVVRGALAGLAVVGRARGYSAGA